MPATDSVILGEMVKIIAKFPSTGTTIFGGYLKEKGCYYIFVVLLTTINCSLTLTCSVERSPF